jgi:NAD(P)-dependent dehydrogenase (short-subunit alcohol dehydrogenase family)
MNKLVLIAGGTSGIGLDTAKYLSQKGYKVIVCGRRTIQSNDLVSIKTDLRSDDSIVSLYNKLIKEYGHIDSLVFCAGITKKKQTIEQFNEKEWDNILNTNVKGFIRLIKIFYTSLKESKGRVVVMNSMAARSFSQFSSIDYSASKGALSAIVRQLAIEWSKDEILINSLFPSMTLTPMLQENLTKKEIDELSNILPLKRLAKTEDIARAVEFLINKNNKYITGSGIDISGGQFLNG